MMWVTIKEVGLNLYLTVPDVEDIKVELSVRNNDEEYNTSQMWIMENSLIKWAERPYLYLSMGEHDALQLTKTMSDNCHWILKSSNLCLMSQPSIGLCLKDNFIIGSNINRLRWSLDAVIAPLPATSCHLRYGPTICLLDDSNWKLECTVQVLESAPCTYFMVVGFGPGGYCGIQELHNGERMAIYSVWNDNYNNVGLLKSNPKAVVSEFGGEGTGIKTMMKYDWKEMDEITFIVEGEAIHSGWVSRCKYKCNGVEYFMSEVIRNSSAPLLNNTGFYSFIEDWERSNHAKGHSIRRKALFYNAKYNGNTLEKALFTKVETGSDAFASDYAKGWATHNGFALQTGKCIDDTNNGKNCLNHTTLVKQLN